MKEYGRSGMEKRGTQAEQKVEWRLGQKGKDGAKAKSENKKSDESNAREDCNERENKFIHVVKSCPLQD